MRRQVYQSAKRQMYQGIIGKKLSDQGIRWQGFQDTDGKGTRAEDGKRTSAQDGKITGVLGSKQDRKFKVARRYSSRWRGRMCTVTKLQNCKNAVETSPTVL
jgi:hypothetical protein